ncbi:MAG TPA: arabinofuranosidase catalytic domain-containing protein [Acidobacteriaceae bacterium]|nr:arabinofuranosidase catalytic domain-containing protein [Acidobacteriaceae bacterium]
MKTRIYLVPMLALALTMSGANLTMAAQASAGSNAAPHRPQGPCDIYAAAGDPCAAAHSTTRALYSSYNGPLYQVLRQSDRKTLDVGVVQPKGSDTGGYANAAAQDAFCANTYCWITTIYDQSGKHNNLTQPPRGGFSGPAMGGYDNIPVADMAPITVMGHKAYGVFIEPGMGLRVDDAKGTAVDDQAEGQYWVLNGQHYNAGCCFDYGNAETDSRDDGNGTMETAYYGDSTGWYHGNAPGPWVMTDQENNLVGCANPDGSKLCASLPNITWRFVTAMAKGEPHHWTSMGGDAQRGALSVMFDGPRINPTYDPMRKQGAILLGNGGDNSNGSQGTFYEGAMTAAGTFPTDATDQLVQANITTAKYDVQQLSIAPASANAAPPELQTFSPGSSQDTTVTFTNTTGARVAGVKLSISAPKAWATVAAGSTTFADSLAPGASVSATFKVTSGPAAFNGDLVANATWTTPGGAKQSATMAEKVRNVGPVKINEFRISTLNPPNPTNSFIELYNAGSASVDISNWTLTEHPTQQAIFSTTKVAAGTKLASGGFYVLGLSNSGLAVPARAGNSTIYVRSTAGMTAGDSISIDIGAYAETRKIASIGTAASNSTTLWQPLPDGPILTVPAGSTSVPVTSVSGFAVGEKIALGYGGSYPSVAGSTERYEVATVTAVGKQGTQAYLGADALAGSTNIKVTNVANISAGDKIRLDIDSVGHGIETVTVTHVGTPSNRGAVAPGTGLELAAPLKFNHAANLPFSDRGTGISFQPALAFAHLSNEPVQALGTGITLDSPLVREHAINAVVHDANVTTAGYQGTEAPSQWFGGPALSPAAGNMVLRNAAGLVVDSLNYGLLVDPWAGEGYQSTSGSGQSGCRVTAPGPGRSAGRYPDGMDTDSNCTDFLTQTASTLAAAVAAGATNIKVASVADFDAGQTIMIDTGANPETAVIATVGTAGASTLDTAADVGATVIPVANAMGFSVGQTITIDTGANSETALVAVAARRGVSTITVAAPLKSAHVAGAQVCGSGITLTTALTQAHASGAQIAGSVPPTPGAPNQYYRRRP